ncbi:hypothetical protein niasHS_017098 [Heterodera schachtii]|uniref:Uncharacterized protein n=1 Tax=Heterodera schachtii TaxID=97005 RepID=A0ABD2I340_HETSC
MSVRKCPSANVRPQMSVRKCPSANVRPQVSVRKCPSANVRKAKDYMTKRETNTDQKWLGFYLWSAAAEKGRREAKPFYLEGWTSSSWTDIQANNWSFKCSATLRIVSQKSDMADFSRDLSGQIFNELSNKSGFSNFITFTELMDQSKGFYDKEADKVKLTIDFIVKEADN